LNFHTRSGIIQEPMKKLSIIASLLVIASGWAIAGEPGKPQARSAEFEKMKGLVGTWKGKMDMGGGETEITVEYHLVSGGSVIEERQFAGTPKEMITMYHDEKGKLALTHYCILGNHPGMALKSADAKTLKFDFDDTCGVDAKNEMHMHSLALTFVDADTITQEWELFQAGKAEGKHPFTLKRVKA
jgi:hypothetical protein